MDDVVVVDDVLVGVRAVVDDAAVVVVVVTLVVACVVALVGALVGVVVMLVGRDTSVSSTTGVGGGREESRAETEVTACDPRAIELVSFVELDPVVEQATSTNAPAINAPELAKARADQRLIMVERIERPYVARSSMRYAPAPRLSKLPNFFVQLTKDEPRLGCRRGDYRSWITP